LKVTQELKCHSILVRILSLRIYFTLQAKFIADKIAEEGRAQAEANRALVSAGLTPEQRMRMDIEIADKVSSNMAKIKFPDIMIFGGDGKNSPTNPFDAVGLDAYRKIVNEIGRSKK
jgi:hypothetical protein